VPGKSFPQKQTTKLRLTYAGHARFTDDLVVLYDKTLKHIAETGGSC